MSKTFFDLDEYLGNLQSEGLEDSQGVFTLSEEKARKKLSDFALDHELAWVKKLLQAVVAWESRTLEIRQTKLYTSFIFCPADLHQIPDRESILRVLESGHVDTTSPIFCFCLALNALVSQAGMSFVCNARRNQDFDHPLASGSDALKISSWQRKAWSHLERQGIRLTVSHVKQGRSFSVRYAPSFALSGLRESIRFDLELSEILKQSAFFLPMPCYLDGLLLNRLSNHSEFGFLKNSQPLILSGVSSDLSNNEPMSVGDHFEEKIMSVYTVPQRADRTYSRRRSFAAWYLLRVRMADKMEEQVGRLYLYWIQNGLVMRKTQRALETSILDLHIFLNGRGKSTDLSGLALVATPDIEREEQRVLQHARYQLGQMVNDVDDLVRDDLDMFSRFDAHPSRPTFNRKDVEEVTLMDFVQAPAGEVLLSGLPFVLGSFTYLAKKTGDQVRDHIMNKEGDRKKWRRLLTTELEKIGAH